MNQLDIFVSCPTRGAPGWLTHQALALGIPSILSAVSASFGLVEDGVSGLLLERGDPDRLARAIEHWVAKPFEAREMGRRARQAALARQPSKRFKEGLDRLLVEDLAAQAGRPLTPVVL